MINAPVGFGRGIIVTFLYYPNLFIEIEVNII